VPESRAAAATTSSRPGLVRDLSVLHAGAIVVGVIIGSGIFLVPKRMMEATGSASVVFTVWIVGGLLSWFGALTYAELGAMKPDAGGEYIYIRDAYGPLAGFLNAWTWFTISKPASIATVAAGVVRILGEFGAFSFLKTTFLHGAVPVNWGHIFAAAMIVVLTWVNYIGVKKAGDFQLFFTSLKVLMILGIIVACFTAKSGTMANFSSHHPGAVGGVAGFMAALIAALWAYDGWNNLNMVAGEIRDPQKNIPRAMIVGIALVAALYMMVNAAVQYVLPATTLAGAERPASLAFQYAMGAAGAAILSAGIALSMFASINGQILTGARIPYAAARDGYFFDSLAGVNERYHTPGGALVFQAFMSIALVVLGGAFEDLFNLAIFSEWLFYMITASTIFVFRRQIKDAITYRTPGYPVVPLLFIAAAAVLLYFSFVQNMKDSVGGTIVILAGIPVFFYFARRKRLAHH
jgi:basic amino acid/polyamine antiporter, APA family